MTDDTRPNVNHGDFYTAKTHEILRTVVGSGVHGIAIEGTDDHDEMGVYIEPPEYVLGIKAWSYVHNAPTHAEGEGMPHFIWRTQPEGARSGPGDTDLVMYSLRKFARLAVKGNPTILLPLWAPQESVLHTTPLGEDLRRLRDAFMSRHAAHRFLRYSESQHERMMGGGKRNRVPNRPELVEAHGWDTKYGSHALRLAYQAYEIILTGRLTLPVPETPRQHVLAVKRGEVSQEATSAEVLALLATARDVLQHGTPLPDDADFARIDYYLRAAHIAAWTTTWADQRAAVRAAADTSTRH